MTLSKNRKAIIVSIFTLVGISIFVIGVLALGGQHKIFISSIAIRSSFKNINGLETGNNVWYEGVKIGTVKSISFSEDSRVAVLMNIEKKSGRYIHNNATAKIGSDGLMGNRIVVIEGGSAEFPTIKNGDTIIAETSLTTLDIINTLQKNNLNLLAITENLKTVSKSLADGDGTLGALIKDKSLLDNLQSAVSIIKSAAINTKRATSDIAEYSSKLQTKGSFTNDLVTDTLIFSKLRTTVSEIRDISKTINLVANNLNKASASLNDSSKFAGALIHGEQMKDNLSELLHNLRSASLKLDEDLEAIQHNFLFRGYFRKKANQQQNKK